MAVTITRKLPSDLQQIVTVTRYDIFKHLRSRRLIGLLIIEIVLIVLLLLVPPLVGNPYPKDPAQFVSSITSTFTTILIVIAVTMFAADAISTEYQNRTGYLLFPNPVKKEVIYLGKFLSTFLIAVLAVTIWYWIPILAGLAVTGSISTLAIESYGLALLYAIAASSLGYLISSIMKGSIGAIVLTFFLLLMILPISDALVGTLGGVEPGYSLTYQAGTIDYIFQTPYPHSETSVIEVPGGGNMTFHTFIPQVGVAVGVMIGYIIIANLVAIIIFKRREMVG
jgi:ABC-2 type transport system permease protein